MSDTAWLAIATIGAGVLGAIGTLITAYFGSRRARRELRDLHERMGNGFATEVVDALGQIAGTQDKIIVQLGIVQKRLNAHINQHAKGVYAVSASKRKR